MGRPKWNLPLGHETIFEHLLQTVCRITPTVVVSLGVGQDGSRFGDARIVHDEFTDCGPIEGIRVALQSLEQQCDAVLVVACDAPLLVPSVAEFLYREIGEFDAVIPVEGRRVFGMTAIYKTAVHSKLEFLVARRNLKVSQLASSLNVKLITAQQLKRFDPELNSLININTPADYFALLQKCELDCPSDLRTELQQWQDQNPQH
jgi:molybdopterin-guanine dinucleotide biosynthesis protein A